MPLEQVLRHGYGTPPGVHASLREWCRVEWPRLGPACPLIGEGTVWGWMVVEEEEEEEEE